MIEIKLDNKAKSTVAKTLDLGASTKALYPAIHQNAGRMVRVHCDKILNRLIAEGADVDIEVSDFNYNNIDIGVFYNAGSGVSPYFATIIAQANSATNYTARVEGFGGYSDKVAITENQQQRFTVRQMLEALGTAKLYTPEECYVLPTLIFNYQATGCFAVTIPLTIDEYLEMVEFNIEITE